ncbi:MAG: class I SAM-dependent methyltransferase [Candidatus Gracilibacteria bacterium]|nr:class I SAM-dependent methyltransferase [Candidatus Gracilibacteria bacterium]
MSDNTLWDYHQKENRKHLVSGHPRQEILLKYIKKYLRKGSKIMEIGFGDGFLLNKLASSGFEVMGQDISGENIQISKGLFGEKIDFLLGDTSGKILTKDESLDGFIALEVLEHMDDAQLHICISEINRVLKKGGLAFITVPAKENLKNYECICPNCSEVFHRWGHKQCFDMPKLKNSFNKFGILVCKEFFIRHVGKNFIENSIGWIMFFLRNILNFFIDIDNKSYLLIIKK